MAFFAVLMTALWLQCLAKTGTNAFSRDEDIDETDD